MTQNTRIKDGDSEPFTPGNVAAGLMLGLLLACFGWVGIALAITAYTKQVF